jgi:hypothetical protein
MAQSRCSCGGTQFEMKELNVNAPSPLGGPTLNKYMAIQCAACGIVVGTHEGWYLSRALAQLAEKLGVELE